MVPTLVSKTPHLLAAGLLTGLVVLGAGCASTSSPGAGTGWEPAAEAPAPAAPEVATAPVPDAPEPPTAPRAGSAQAPVIPQLPPPGLPRAEDAVPPADPDPADAEAPAAPRPSDPVPGERLLFGEELGWEIAPEVVFEPTEPDDDAGAPVFDMLGSEAKSSYVQGAILGQRGYNSRAVENYVAAAERDPENLWLKYRASMALLSQNDLPRARRMAEEILAADPQNVRAMLLMATIASYRDDAAQAREWYLKALEIQPRNLQALESLAHLSFVRDRDMEATKEYAGRILKITSRNLNAMLWHAEANALTGNVAEAADLYQQLTRHRPSLIGRLADMALRLKRQGAEADALELLRRGIVMAPEIEPLRLQWEVMVLESGAGPDGIEAGYRSLCDEHPLDLRIQEVLAEFYARSSKPAKLREQRERMLGVDPRHIPSLLSLARLDLAEGNTESATTYFELAIAAGPDQASTYRDIAMVYIEQGNVERAGQLLTEAAILDPEDAETLVAMAALAERDDNKQRAEQLLKRAIDASPANEKFLTMLADFYRRENRLAEAAQVYESVLATNPTDRRVVLTLALMYFETGNTAGLDFLQETHAKATEGTGDFAAQYGSLAMEYGDWGRARWALERALREAPDSPALRLRYATTLHRLGDTATAAEVVREGASRIPEGDGTARAAYLFGYFTGVRDWANALEHARALADADPSSVVARGRLLEVLHHLDRQDEITAMLNDIMREFARENPRGAKMLRAEVLQRRGEFDRAISALAPVVQEAPDDVEASFQLAVLHGEARNLGEADRLYTRIQELTADKPEYAGYRLNAFNNLAYLLAREGVELERAEELARTALEMAPREGYILDTMGWVQFQRKNYPDAEKYLLQAARLSPDDAEIHENLGDLYRETGRQSLALEQYERALALEEDRTAVRDKIDSLRLALRREGTAPAP